MGKRARRARQGLCPEVTQGSVAIPGEDFIYIQDFVNRGGNPWRLNPVETAKVVGTSKLGLNPADIFVLFSKYVDFGSGLHHAVIHVHHGPCRFLMDLYQPVKQGPGGIWAVQTVQRMP